MLFERHMRNSHTPFNIYLYVYMFKPYRTSSNKHPWHLLDLKSFQVRYLLGGILKTERFISRHEKLIKYSKQLLLRYSVTYIPELLVISFDSLFFRLHRIQFHLAKVGLWCGREAIIGERGLFLLLPQTNKIYFTKAATKVVLKNKCLKKSQRFSLKTYATEFSKEVCKP